jgi:replicative DNA helicase
MDAGIDQHRLRTGWIEDDEWDRIITAMEHLSEANIWIDDTAGISTMEVRSKARRLQAEHGIDLIIVDYLQLMQSNIGGKRNENRVQEVSEISRSLKGLARELDVPILALAQLSRTVESRQSKVPQLSDLRESGCLAGDTLVYLPDHNIYRPIEQLVGQSGFNVLALNTQTGNLEMRPVMMAFATGYKPVYKLKTQLGRTIRATANHKFLTIHGWKRLDEIANKLPTQEVSTSYSRTFTLLEAPIDRAHADLSRWCGVSTLTYDGSPASGDGSTSTICTINRRAHDQSAPLELLPNWDNIISIEPDGEADVYDLTVDEHHNFVANNVIVHNSIEQDADVVMFIYRDDVYNPETDRKNIADIIVAKHRNGPVGEVSLFFQSSQTRFRDLEVTPPVEE